ncbi:hypothetical protein ZIOFF_019465 [Zingiber officinale]|uniref:Uncharacterized protein n=1 Tax=Zingiber officinale TaxID=94328 RepID=A0A8J5HEB6_ZINOF|nr:hypothetical protein ZIOFF_019465 [Zingiber officinale]
MEPPSSAPVAKRYLMSSSPPLALSTGIHCRGATAAATALLRVFSRMSSGGTSSHARLPFAVAAEAEKTLNPYLQHHHHLSLSSTSQFLPNPKFFQISAPRITVGVSGRSMSRSVSSISSEAADGSAPPLVVLSFYKFADFPDHATMRKPLKELCEDVVSAKISPFGPFTILALFDFH